MSVYAIYLLIVYSFSFFGVLEKKAVRYNFSHLSRFDVVSYDFSLSLSSILVVSI